MRELVMEKFNCVINEIVAGFMNLVMVSQKGVKLC